MLLPVMITVGSHILGWELIDLDIVLQVRARLWFTAAIVQMQLRVQLRIVANTATWSHVAICSDTRRRVS